MRWLLNGRGALPLPVIIIMADKNGYYGLLTRGSLQTPAISGTETATAGGRPWVSRAPWSAWPGAPGVCSRPAWERRQGGAAIAVSSFSGRLLSMRGPHRQVRRAGPALQRPRPVPWETHTCGGSLQRTQAAPQQHQPRTTRSRVQSEPQSQDCKKCPFFYFFRLN